MPFYFFNTYELKIIIYFNLFTLYKAQVIKINRSFDWRHLDLTKIIYINIVQFINCLKP